MIKRVTLLNTYDQEHILTKTISVLRSNKTAAKKFLSINLDPNQECLYLPEWNP